MHGDGQGLNTPTKSHKNAKNSVVPQTNTYFRFHGSIENMFKTGINPLQMNTCMVYFRHKKEVLLNQKLEIPEINRSIQCARLT